MYKSEAAFSKAFVAEARNQGWLAQRLESAVTGCGIPDIVMAKDGNSVWVELKNAPYLTGACWPLTISWRKGQQAWALNWLKYANRPTFTVVALNKSYIIIPMTKHFKANKVERNGAMCTLSLPSVFGLIKEMLNEQ